MISREADVSELDVVHFPLTGSRLIEASAGTGKTYTIAALFVRLVLGHGTQVENAIAQGLGVTTGFHRPLLPSEILVMTFTKAATQELSSRIQARLSEVAEIFRQDSTLAVEDEFVKALLESYATTESRMQAAWQLEQAALCMDEASVFTIDAWCQKVLKEHAIHTGQPFDEELVVNEQNLRRQAVQDFWRRTVYAMNLDLAKKIKRIFPREIEDLTSEVESHFKNQKSKNGWQIESYL
jgi:exodeoxyribonuclease V beta subunit